MLESHQEMVSLLHGMLVLISLEKIKMIFVFGSEPMIFMQMEVVIQSQPTLL